MLFLENENIGTLDYDKVLIENNEPILFTCLSDKNELLLGTLCSVDKNEKKWLLTKTTPEIIVKILKDEISLRDAFIYFTDLQLSISDNSESIEVSFNEKADWDDKTSIYLPDADEFMEVEVGEFAEELEYYGNLVLENIQLVPIYSNKQNLDSGDSYQIFKSFENYLISDLLKEVTTKALQVSSEVINRKIDFSFSDKIGVEYSASKFNVDSKYISRSFDKNIDQNKELQDEVERNNYLTDAA
jgi:hypothetical protein